MSCMYCTCARASSLYTMEFKLSPPSQCCSKAALRRVFARRLPVVSGRGSFVVVWSAAGCVIGPLDVI